MMLILKVLKILSIWPTWHFQKLYEQKQKKPQVFNKTVIFFNKLFKNEQYLNEFSFSIRLGFEQIKV